MSCLKQAQSLAGEYGIRRALVISWDRIQFWDGKESARKKAAIYTWLCRMEARLIWE